MNSKQVVSLGSLEADLGLSRVDLLLMIRELGIEQIRQGMRTWIRQDEATRLYQHLGKSNPREPLLAEVVQATSMDEQAMVPFDTPTGHGDEEFRRYSKLRLLRERIEVLNLLQTTAVELSSHEICSILDLKRIPPLEQLGDGMEGFHRMGMEFLKMRRNGQRTTWKVRPPSST